MRAYDDAGRVLVSSNLNGSGTGYYDFRTDFHSTQLGECSCAGTGTGTTSLLERCSDNTRYFWVRVYRRSGAGSDCQPYVLQIRNE